MPAILLTLLSKPGCHLCDDARSVVTEVLAGLPTLVSPDGAVAVMLEEKSILDDAALFDEYVEEIPVVLINGRVHTVWRVDAARLTAALTEAALSGPAPTSRPPTHPALPTKQEKFL